MRPSANLENVSQEFELGLVEKAFEFLLFSHERFMSLSDRIIRGSLSQIVPFTIGTLVP